MKLFKLLQVANLNQALQEIYKYWPDEAEKEEGYRQVYAQLLQLPWKRSEIDFISVILSPGFGEGNTYPNVSGRTMGDETNYAIEYIPWEEWLGLEIQTEFDHNATLGHILYEMTWAGFDQEQIAEQMEDIKNLEDEILLEEEKRDLK